MYLVGNPKDIFFRNFSRWMDGETLNMLTPKMVGNRPNTYTYTKAIAEYLLQVDLGSLPVVIVRPSIVGATYQEPVKVSILFMLQLVGSTVAQW